MFTIRFVCIALMVGVISPAAAQTSNHGLLGWATFPSLAGKPDSLEALPPPPRAGSPDRPIVLANIPNLGAKPKAAEPKRHFSGFVSRFSAGDRDRRR